MRWLALLSLLSIGVWQDADPGLIIRSDTTIVQVRVVAQDAKGNPVTDLKRENFQLQDNRKSQPITLFVAETGAAPSIGSQPQSKAQGVLPANEYSLLLIDWLNTSYADRVFSQEQVLKLLTTYQPRQKVAIYLLGRDPRLLCDFTADTELLRQVILDAGFEPEEMGPGQPVNKFDARYAGRAGQRLSAEEQFFDLNNRVNDSLRNLQVIADRLGRIPGRKSLIWLSAAFPAAITSRTIPGLSVPADYQAQLERLLARLNRSDVAVYPVDSQGLTTHNYGFRGTMQQLAERTGGMVFVDRNDLDAGIRLALEDMRVSYVLGFHVPQGAAPGLHEIRVKVNRPNLLLRYRESYQLAEPAPSR